MKKFIPYLLAFALLAGCKDPFEGQLFEDAGDDDTKITNIAYMEKHSDEYSLFLQFLHDADYYNALNDASSTVTVFAPDNEAMRHYMQSKNIESFKDLDSMYLRQIAQVHMLKGSLSEGAFIQYLNEGSIQIPTVFGDYLELSYGYVNTDVDDDEKSSVSAQDTLNIYINNTAPVLEMARQTANGMVYRIGGVIRPMSENLLIKLEEENQYGIFLDAIKATHWDDTLKIEYDTIPQLMGGYTVNKIDYTLFAVPDDVYHNQGINSVDDLASHLGTTDKNYSSDNNALHRYVAYHILDGDHYKSDLLYGSTEGGRTLSDTRLKHEVIAIENHGGRPYLNGDSISGSQIIRSDIKASNGIIHKIDRILPVYCPEPVTVIWDFCSTSDVVSIVNAYGASTNNGNLYSTPCGTNEFKVDLTENCQYGTANFFTYKKATTKNSSWANVGYFKCKKGSEPEWENEFNAYLNNLLTVNVGYTGWIQLKTPTIIKGKYRVELYYAGVKTLKSLYSQGSLVKFTMDDYMKQLYTWRGRDGSDHSVKGEVLFDYVEFEVSESHTLKAVFMDLKASDNANYHQRWDYIKFTPINE